MKTLTINLPDNLDLTQERRFLAVNWYQSGKLSATQAAEIAGLNVALFLTLAEPFTSEDQLLKLMARPAATDFDRAALEQAGRRKKLDWHKLDTLADAIAADGTMEELLAQIGK